ncbi:MAG: C40 family peptidase [Bacteroidales bacterium]|nr:C40 family peptidase [Bacteroidales bacterium]
MKTPRPILLLLAAATLLFAGCDALKTFLNRDLAEEDFIIGQLYVDEMVKETPVIARPVAAPSNPSRSNPLGLDYSPDDNQQLYQAINSWLGVPYKYGGTDRSGIDCSAFVGTIYKQVYGVTLHRSANDMLRDVTLIPKSQLREGDILFFTNSKGKVSHVGIYLKEQLFAHASTSNGVSVSRLDNTYWTKHFYKGGRVKK